LTARLLRAFALTVLVWTVSAGLAPQPRAADLIEARNARLDPAADGDGWQLSVDFAIPLPGRLEEAVNRGVALYFVVEFELARPRWYWWDEKSAQAAQAWRLSYHALTRQYRVTRDGFAQTFASLEEAMQTMSRVRGWRVLAPEQARAGTDYQAQVRMRLDVSMMPKPFQVTAITNRDWNLQAEWTRFRFTP
jgi:hypothetical protein